MRYDKFESLSLALPSGAGDLGWGRHKLHQLLTNFVTPEVVQDVQCEGCNKDRDPARPPTLSRQIKILNFGKVRFQISFIEIVILFHTSIDLFSQFFDMKFKRIKKYIFLIIFL